MALCKLCNKSINETLLSQTDKEEYPGLCEECVHEAVAFEEDPNIYERNAEYDQD